MDRKEFYESTFIKIESRGDFEKNEEKRKQGQRMEQITQREETIKQIGFTRTHFTCGLCTDCLLSEIARGKISTSATK